MRILYEDEFFVDVLRKYMEEPYLKGCIVMRTAYRKKLLKDIFRAHGKELNIRICDNVVVFNNTKSLIHLKCLAERASIIYDEIILDSQINDEETIQKYAEHEYNRMVADLGEIEPSFELLEYIGGVHGNA